VQALSNSTILKIHFVISGALAAAVRWDWIVSNPADVAKKPRQLIPQPKPPTPEQAGKITNAAWEQDPGWGMLVWLVMVTGVRRAEVLALRWRHVDLAGRTLAIERNHLRARGKTYEKATKTHQERRISLDSTTAELLNEHRRRYEKDARSIDIDPSDEAYLFSHEVARGRTTRMRSPTATRTCAPKSGSTPTFMRHDTIPRPSCSPTELTCAQWPVASATAAEVRPRCACTPPGSASPTAEPLRSSAVDSQGRHPALSRKADQLRSHSHIQPNALHSNKPAVIPVRRGACPKLYAAH
jgi:hypothetical protein